MEPELEIQTSTLGIRSLAALIDSSVACICWYYLIESFGQIAPAGIHATTTIGGDKTLTGLPALLLVLATGIFWIIPEWLIGATAGKLICGLRVVSLEGRQISLVQSLKRNILRLLDFFPFYLTGFLTATLTPKHQRLGDLWAKTIVVRNKKLQSRAEVSLQSKVG